MGAAFIWQLIVIAMVGYLIGSINLSIILSHLMGKGDIRNYGSGNAGTTNTLRTLGKLPALAVLLFDIFKGVIAIYAGVWLMGLGIGNMDAEYMDLAPNKIMHLVQLGLVEEALKSNSIWLCATCSTCSVRCPKGLDIAHEMESLRILAKEKGIVQEKNIDKFYCSSCICFC